MHASMSVAIIASVCGVALLSSTVGVHAAATASSVPQATFDNLFDFTDSTTPVKLTCPGAGPWVNRGGASCYYECTAPYTAHCQDECCGTNLATCEDECVYTGTTQGTLPVCTNQCYGNAVMDACEDECDTNGADIDLPKCTKQCKTAGAMPLCESECYTYK